MQYSINTPYFKKTNSCRGCYAQKLLDVLSLGQISIVDFSSYYKKGIKVPLDLILCGKCNLLQLRYAVSRDLLFRRKYWYKSGINQTMRNELKEIVDEVSSIARLNPHDSVLDIGCNDGTLLRSYKTKNIQLFGVDPAENLIDYAKEGTTKIINDFFSYKACRQHFGDIKFKIITAIAMFYDLDNPNSFLSDVRKLLDTDGIFIIQQNYLVDMIKNNAFDNIVHEHLEYYSLVSLENLLKKHHLTVFNISRNGINGGSFRTYIKHSKSPVKINKSVEKIRKYEKNIGLGEIDIYKNFRRNVKDSARNIFAFIKREISKRRKIYAYGASTRGNTILQYCRLNNRFITAIAERNPLKWRKITMDTNIPIISEEEARKAKPDYFFVLPWYFKKEFIKREKIFIQSGGKLIFPLPQLEVYPS